jgi:hypothetical protein
MKRLLPYVPLVWVLVLGASAPLSAQQPSLDFKIHAGLTGGTLRKDLGDNQMFGLGFQGTYPLQGKGALTFEADFDVLEGRWHDATPGGGPVYYNPASPVASSSGQPLVLDPNSSIDIRKESQQGFTFRFGYTNALPWIEGMTWQAGLSLDAFKTSSEFTGTLIPLDATTQSPMPPTGTEDSYYEGWAFVKKKAKPGIGAFVGVGTTLIDNVRLELNMRTNSYTHYDYRPFTYTGRPAALESSQRMGLVFEVALAMTI